jgi:predicted secreted protein
MSSWLSGVVVYLMIWWLVFFMALPFGVRSQAEEKEKGTHEIVPGTAESAPVKPNLWLKALVTSIIAGVLYGVFYYMMINDWFGLINVRTY